MSRSTNDARPDWRFDSPVRAILDYVMIFIILYYCKNKFISPNFKINRKYIKHFLYITNKIRYYKKVINKYEQVFSKTRNQLSDKK